MTRVYPRIRLSRVTVSVSIRRPPFNVWRVTSPSIIVNVVRATSAAVRPFRVRFQAFAGPNKRRFGMISSAVNETAATDGVAAPISANP